jgi:hypothetical protein
MLQDQTAIGRFDSDADSVRSRWEGSVYPSFDSIAQPDCILPSQFHRRRQAVSADGEVRLLIAVLQDAINCYARGIGGKTKRHREQFEEADWWFHAADQRGLFAFENICEVLEIDADKLRRWLGSLRAGDGAGAATDGAVTRRRRWRIDLSERSRRPHALSARRSRTRASHSKVTRPPEGSDMVGGPAGYEPAADREYREVSA